MAKTDLTIDGDTHELMDRREQGTTKPSLVILLAGLLATMCAVPIAARLGAQAGTPTGLQQRGLSPAQERALHELVPTLSRFDVDENGVPSWLAGDLGPAATNPEAAALEALRRLAPAFRMTPNDGFDVRGVIGDELGQVHVRMRQRYRNLLVAGSELIVHVASGRIVGVNGRFSPDINVGSTPTLDAATALRPARGSLASGRVSELSVPELTVFVAPGQVAHLAWQQKVTYVNAEGLQREWIFADARNGELLGRRSLMHSAKFRQIYDGNHACYVNSAQQLGDLLFEEGVTGSQWVGSDAAAKAAYTGMGTIYDFYKDVFNRDSYDGWGTRLAASVHFEFNGQNGCGDPNFMLWSSDAQQIVAGDGDGVTYGLLPTALDLTAHEFTHGVTDFTAALLDYDESGAISEAVSDIFGENVDYFFNGSTDWKIGEDVYTPTITGDALRYMNDPALDDPHVPDGFPCYFVSSRDYYPDRYQTADNYPYCDDGGVHVNSGIANLAFYLMSAGGSHPRGKTSIVVPAIGIEQARRIWYKALADKMNATTDFADARKATVAAAEELYGCKALNPAIVNAVKLAWDAVGVPDASQNGWALLGLSGPVYITTNPCLYVLPASNLLLNPGFENGAAIWIGRTAVTNAPAQPAHGGTFKAWLGRVMPGVGTMHQQVTIPSVTTTATLSFWLHIETDETGNSASDTLDVQLRNADDLVLTTLATYSNLDKNNAYVQQSFDVTPYKGQTLRVTFKATSSSSNQTSFVVDDTALNIK